MITAIQTPVGRCDEVVIAFKIAGSRAARQPHVTYQLAGAIRMKHGGNQAL
jgi:hypothetical protein